MKNFKWVFLSCYLFFLFPKVSKTQPIVRSLNFETREDIRIDPNSGAKIPRVCIEKLTILFFNEPVLSTLDGNVLMTTHKDFQRGRKNWGSFVWEGIDDEGENYFFFPKKAANELSAHCLFSHIKPKKIIFLLKKGVAFNNGRVLGKDLIFHREIKEEGRNEEN